MVNDNTIDSATYLSLSGRYRLPMRNERTWELFATINNALDEDPPLAPDGGYQSKIEGKLEDKCGGTAIRPSNH